MNYNITGKHLDISDAVRSYVEEKLGKLEMQQITSTQITLRAENHLKIAEATLHLASGKTIHGDAAHEDIYTPSAFAMNFKRSPKLTSICC